ncbi:MAG TPA: PepSY-associated TM helix domain-containing protein [Cytophagaceae bacterium]
MSENNSRQGQAKLLRTFRKIHRITGALLFVFFFIIAITGLLLAWKKNSNGLIHPKSHVGTSTDLKDWLHLDSLHSLACKALHESVSADLSLDLDRIDIRQDKGMVKFIFKHHYWGIQLDGATGKLLHIERRRADFIENVHDGSVMDRYLGTKGEPLKLVYSSIMGIALLIFTITGFWLWYGPKKMRKNKANLKTPNYNKIQPD